jgi:hypothetical protein
MTNSVLTKRISYTLGYVQNGVSAKRGKPVSLLETFLEKKIFPLAFLYLL